MRDFQIIKGDSLKDCFSQAGSFSGYTPSVWGRIKGVFFLIIKKIIPLAILIPVIYYLFS